MARKTKDDKSTDVVEYDDDGVAIEREEDEEFPGRDPLDPSQESYMAPTADGGTVEVIVSEQQQTEAAAALGLVEGDEEDVEGDWPGKEEDAELARRQHELGIDNQLTDDHLEAKGV